MNEAIIFESKEDDDFRKNMESYVVKFCKEKNIDKAAILDYPTVYIHTWKRKREKKLYDVYVGESNNVVERTGQHWHDSQNKSLWQHHLTEASHAPVIYVLGHKCFNKSLTLDLENRLIQYVTSLGGTTVREVYNGRGNPQRKYYTDDKFESIFSDVWQQLRKKNEELFLTEDEVKNLALFKASPMLALTEEQSDAQKLIVEKVCDAVKNKKKDQLIFVEGEAGSGKTVLTSHVFYDLFHFHNDKINKIKTCLLVNHDEQFKIFKDMAETLNLKDEKKNIVVYKPTSFINKKKEVDVAFVDESHLLLTRGKQSYVGKNQLHDIMNLARVTVVMFDANQILAAEQYLTDEAIQSMRDLSKKQENYVSLKNQMRMQASPQVLSWIDNFSKEGKVTSIPNDDRYEIKIFKSPNELHNAIKNVVKNPKYKLSRLIASYDWPYKNKVKNDGTKWGVNIDKWFLPWNRESFKLLNRKDKKNLSNKSWHEQSQTIDEVGSIYTIQGFDLAYSGVILGKSIKYIDGKIVFDPKESCNGKAVQKRTMDDGSKQTFAKRLLKNELRVLMTRGVYGLYIYACDEGLRNALLKAQCNKGNLYSLDTYRQFLGLDNVAASDPLNESSPANQYIKNVKKTKR